MKLHAMMQTNYSVCSTVVETFFYGHDDEGMSVLINYVNKK